MLIRACALATADAPVTDVTELRFDQRERSRLRAPLATGEEIGIDLPVGTILSHGSRLALADGRIVAVEAAREHLLLITADAPATLRAYAADQADYEAWCAKVGLVAIPAAPAPFITSVISDIFLPATLAAFIIAALATIAVPC